MTRSRTWDTQELAQHLADRANAPHVYGQNDCCLFACDGIRAMTGVDIAENFRGYKTERGALKAIRKVTGGSTVEHAAEYVASKYGLTEHPAPLMARRGDLVLVEEAEGLKMALVHLDGTCAVVPGEIEMKRVPLTSIKRSWRV